MGRGKGRYNTMASAPLNPETDLIEPFSAATADYTDSGTLITPESRADVASVSFSDNNPRFSDIDELLVDILGEEYRCYAKSEQHKKEVHDLSTGSSTKYITGSKELDDLVESILGIGWEKDDGNAREIVSRYSQAELDELVESILGKGWDIDDEPSPTTQFSSGTPRLESVGELHDTPEQVEIDILEGESDHGTLIEPILSDSETVSPVQPINAEPVDDRDITQVSKTDKSEEEPDTRPTPGLSRPRNIIPPTQTNQNADYRPVETDDEEKKSRPLLMGFLSLVVLVGVVGPWEYFTSTDDIDLSNVNEINYVPAIRDDVTRQDVTIDYASPIRGSAPVNKTTTTAGTALGEDSLGLSNEAEISAFEYEAIGQNAAGLSNNSTVDYDMEDIETVATTTGTALEEDSPGLNGEAEFSTVDSETKAEDMLTIVIPIEKNIVPEENIEPEENIKPGKVSAPSTPEIIIYTIVKNDTLWSIAKRFVNNPYKYKELARQNKVINPDLIYPGNQIRIIKKPR